MNLPSCITPSKAAGTSLLSALLSVLLAGGGAAPPPADERAPGNTEQAASEKGPGSINFHYANKSTDARMDLDLGSTDVYLEMSGKVVETDEAAAGAEEKHPNARAQNPDQSQHPQQNQYPQNPQAQQMQRPQA